MKTENNLQELAQQANLKIIQGEYAVTIRQQLHLRDKSTFGVALFLLFGIMLIILTIIKKLDTAPALVVIATGLFIVLMSILTLIRQAMDFVTIAGNHIRSRYNLRYTSFPITDATRIEMKTEKRTVRRSTFYHVCFYLHTAEKELPLLAFERDNAESEKANRLGKAIKDMLEEKIN